MPRPLTRAQALQNQAFLAALARTGNVREAARSLGVHRSTFTKRRAKHPAFAAEWDATLAVADARLHRPARGAAGKAATAGEGAKEGAAPPLSAPGRRAAADRGHLVRTAAGRLQWRRPVERRCTRADEQAFLSALSATANIRLSAAAAGFSHTTFYHRKRESPAFAREMRLALQTGYERLEMALLASLDPASHADDAWRHNEPPPIPPMSAAQALQLLYLHQKGVLSLDEPPHLKRRRGESRDAHRERLAAMGEARLARGRAAFAAAEAMRLERGEPSPFEPAPPALPDLAQVTGWSTADPTRAPHDPDRALFGGWRIDGKKRSQSDD